MINQDELIDWIEKKQAVIRLVLEDVDDDGDYYFSGEMQGLSDVIKHIKENDGGAADENNMPVL